MKFLILACFLGFAAASYIRDAVPAVDDDIYGVLTAALDMPDIYEFDRSERGMTELGEKLRNALNQILNSLEEQIDKGYLHLPLELGKKILAKIADLREEIRKLTSDAKDVLIQEFKRILEQINKVRDEMFKDHSIEKRNIEEILNFLKDGQFRDLIEYIKKKISENESVQKIREYLREFLTTNSFVEMVKGWIEKLPDSLLKDLISKIRNIIFKNERSLKELWEKIKDYFKNLKIELQEKFMKFGEWVKEKLQEKLKDLKDKTEIVKKIAREFIEHSKDISREVKQEGLEFFKQFKDDLGDLWNQIQEVVKGKDN